MTKYSKLWAALGGLIAILAVRYGFDLESPLAAVLMDFAIAGATAAGVYLAPNTKE